MKRNCFLECLSHYQICLSTNQKSRVFISTNGTTLSVVFRSFDVTKSIGFTSRDEQQTCLEETNEDFNFKSNTKASHYVENGNFISVLVIFISKVLRVFIHHLSV